MSARILSAAILVATAACLSSCASAPAPPRLARVRPEAAGVAEVASEPARVPPEEPVLLPEPSQVPPERPPVLPKPAPVPPAPAPVPPAPAPEPPAQVEAPAEPEPVEKQPTEAMRLAQALAGTYMDPGRDDADPPAVHSLVSSLVDNRETRADRFTLSVADEELEVVAWRGTERLSSARLPLAVSDGRVIARRSWGDTGAGPGHVQQTESWLLAKDADGSLTAELDHSVRGVALLVPISKARHFHVRFAQATDPS